MQDGEFDNLSFEILRDTPFIIQEDPLVSIIWSRLPIQAPAEEQPFEKYPSKLAFLRAKAAGNLCKVKEASLLLFEERLAESLKQDEIDNSNNSLENI